MCVNASLFFFFRGAVGFNATPMIGRSREKEKNELYWLDCVLKLNFDTSMLGSRLLLHFAVVPCDVRKRLSHP